MVSIITSVYNCEKYVSEMIDSILAQTYYQWEMIIIDDASTDSTWDVISKYHDARIKKIRNTENEGLTKNLNKGIACAKGEYIARIDGDDIAYPNRLEVQVNYMETHPDIALSGCWMKIFGEKTDIAQSNLDEEKMNINLIMNTVMFHPTFMIRKSILDKYGIRYNENLKYAQDYELEYQLSKYGKLSNISDVLVKYRIHNGQVSIEKYQEQMKCANIVRKEVLSDINIQLSDSDFADWCNFCLMKPHDIYSQERVKKIINDIIKSNLVLEKYNQELLEKIMHSAYRKYMKKLITVSEAIQISNDIVTHNKYYAMYIFMIRWMEVVAKKKSIENYFLSKGISKLAIYGTGHIGRLIYNQLKNSDVTVLYGIDQNIENNFISEDIPLYTIEELFPDVQAIIVTPFYAFQEIKKNLQKKVKCKLFSVDEMIEEILANERI